MTESLHAEDRSYPSSQSGESEQILFRDSPLLSFGFVFIHSSNDEGEDIDEKEISDEYAGPGHKLNKLIKNGYKSQGTRSRKNNL